MRRDNCRLLDPSDTTEPTSGPILTDRAANRACNNPLWSIAAMRTPSDAEALVELACSPEQVPFATAIRSTTLVSSLGAVQGLGLGDVYFEHLPPIHHATMRELVAGHWQPMSLAMAHYAAVEALRLPTADARANGRRVADNVQNGHFGTMLRVLGSAVKMELVLPRFPLLVGRLVQGGACAVYKTGAHEARLELHGIPIAAFDYVRALA